MKFKIFVALLMLSSYASAAPVAGMGKVASVSRMGSTLTLVWDGSFATVPGPEVYLSGNTAQIEQCEKYALLAMASERLLLAIPARNDPRENTIKLSPKQQCAVQTVAHFRSQASRAP